MAHRTIFSDEQKRLETRPIYHRKQDAIRAHALICFVALMIEKFLGLSTNLSLRGIRSLVWSTTETHVQDKFTKEIFTFRSPTKDTMESPLGKWVKKWNLLPH
jgi:transposase